MESRAKLFGHPIHQMLIVFPVGLLVMAVIFDILYLVTGSNLFAVVAFYNIAGGVLGGVLAAIFGLVDFLAIPGGTRARRIGLWHGLGNFMVLLLFSFSWIARLNSEGYLPGTLAQVISFLGVGLAAMTAWMGGELVGRLGVGVDPGANLNAPSSLVSESTRPLALEQIPVTGETNVLDGPSVEPDLKAPLPPEELEGEEKSGKIIDEP